MSAPLPGSPTAARSLQGPGILLGRRNRSQRTVTAAGARFRPCIDIHKVYALMSLWIMHLNLLYPV